MPVVSEDATPTAVRLRASNPPEAGRRLGAVPRQKEPTRDEALGVLVVSTVMQCRARFIDTGGSTLPVVDYELDLPNGEKSGLEISRITDEKLLRLCAPAQRLDWEIGQSSSLVEFRCGRAFLTQDPARRM